MMGRTLGGKDARAGRHRTSHIWEQRVIHSTLQFLRLGTSFSPGHFPKHKVR